MVRRNQNCFFLIQNNNRIFKKRNIVTLRPYHDNCFLWWECIYIYNMGLIFLYKWKLSSFYFKGLSFLPPCYSNFCVTQLSIINIQNNTVSASFNIHSHQHHQLRTTIFTQLDVERGKETQ